MSVVKEGGGPEQILEAAARLFAERGYSNVSIRDICKAAGTSAPMIYYYFRNKRGLFQAVAKRKVSMKDFISSLERAVKVHGSERRIRSFVHVYLSSFPEAAFSVGLYLKDTAELDKDNANRVAKGFDEIQKMVVELVEEGIKEGVFRKSDPARAADMLIGLLNHVVFQRIHFERGYDIKSSEEYLSDFFIRAMR